LPSPVSIVMAKFAIFILNKERRFLSKKRDKFYWNIW
jgi:hypothetical protein